MSSCRSGTCRDVVKHLQKNLAEKVWVCYDTAAVFGMQVATVATVATISDIQRRNIYNKMNESEGGS